MSGTILVSGGGRGIGRAVAERFGREGWSVSLLSRTESELKDTQKAVEAAGGRGLVVTGDVTHPEDAERAVAATVEAFGGLDVLVNNAGIFRTAPLLETSDALWDAVVGTNLTGAFRLTRAAVRSMVEQQRRGFVINVSSVAGKQGFPGSGAYCASKYGILGFGDAVREELRPHGIRVVNVCPGEVDTAAWDTCGLDLAALGIERSKMMTPGDVAESIAGAVLLAGTAVPEELILRPAGG